MLKIYVCQNRLKKAPKRLVRLSRQQKAAEINFAMDLDVATQKSQ